MRKAILAMLLAFALPAYGQAGAQQDQWMVYGTGKLTCGNWLAAREQKNETQKELFIQWMAGWIVSYNYYLTERPQSPVTNPDFETITAFLDNYCKDRPLSPVAYGAAELIEQLGGSKAFHNRPPPRK